MIGELTDVLNLLANGSQLGWWAAILWSLSQLAKHTRLDSVLSTTLRPLYALIWVALLRRQGAKKSGIKKLLCNFAVRGDF